MKTKKAFTLVELLVVISIIAILLAILMPALSKVREQGRMTVCRANEKTLVMAATLWSGDNDGWAIAGDWYKPYRDIVGGVNNGAGASSLEKYTNCSYRSTNLIGRTPSTSTTSSNKPQTSMVCPSAVNVKFIVHEPPDYTPDSKIYSYAANGWILFNQRGPGKPPMTGRDDGGWIGPKNFYWNEHGFNKMSYIRRPNETAFFIDHQYYATMSWTFDPTIVLATSKMGEEPLTMPCETRWHGSRKDKYGYKVGNIGWVDGHTSVEPADFLTPYKDSKLKWTYYFWNH